MKNNYPNMSPQDERIMAALSHVSVLLPLIGTLSPILIWVTQKEKSRYVAFHSLQALAYQLSMVLAYALGMGCYICSFIGNFGGLFFGLTTEYQQYAYPIMEFAFIIPFIVMCSIFLGGIIYVIYGLIGAIMAFQGKHFQYIIIGKRVRNYMNKKQE
jgi:uncharacterized Tic20 family protein